MQTVTRGTHTDASVAALRLHVIYRSAGGDNRKARPAFYSKRTALLSFLRAWWAVPAEERGEMIFLNDGAVGEDRLAPMRHAGVVDARSGLQIHGSYWAALDLALATRKADDDLVYLAEDDYLYRREALAAIVAAARALEW